MPLDRIALERAQRLSVDIEEQLTSTRGGAPLIALLAMAQTHAAAAMVSLVDASPDDPARIRELQTDLRCYDRIVQWLKQIVEEGFVGDDLFNRDRREEMMETLGLVDDDEAQRILDGLPPTEDE